MLALCQETWQKYQKEGKQETKIGKQQGKKGKKDKPRKKQRKKENPKDRKTEKKNNNKGNMLFLGVNSFLSLEDNKNKTKETKTNKQK